MDRTISLLTTVQCTQKEHRHASRTIKEDLETNPHSLPRNPKKSLEIQAEIVRILDAFTELTAELTAELPPS